MAETPVEQTEQPKDDSHVHAKSFSWPGEVKATEPAVEAKEEAETPAETAEAKAEEKPAEKVAAKAPEKKETRDPQKRISQAFYERRKAEERAEAAEARLAQLEQENTRLRTTPVEKKEEKAVVPEKFQSWDTWQVEHDGQTYEDYLDARADWRAGQRGLLTKAEAEAIAKEKAQETLTAARMADREASARTVAEARGQKFFEGTEVARGKYEDYATTVEESDLPTNATMEEYIRRSGVLSGELLYYLGTHGDECQRIAQLNVPAEVIEEMALIKARFKDAPAGPSATERKVTKAPAPPKPVGGASAGAASANLSTSSMADYSRIRAEQRRERAARI